MSVFYFNKSNSSSLLRSPMDFFATSPSFTTINIGMLAMWKRCISSTCSSTLTFPTFSVLAFSSAISSTIGLTAAQGPHQDAQKSRSTGLSDKRTSCSKLSFVICIVLMVVPLSLEFFCLIILIIPEKCVLSVTKSHKYSFAWGILIEKKRKEDTSCMILSLSVRELLA